jgi:hypothetical protein
MITLPKPISACYCHSLQRQDAARTQSYKKPLVSEGPSRDSSRLYQQNEEGDAVECGWNRKETAEIVWVDAGGETEFIAFRFVAVVNIDHLLLTAELAEMEGRNGTPRLYFSVGSQRTRGWRSVQVDFIFSYVTCIASSSRSLNLSMSII